jgi:RNA polymerase sigma-70 factor (sigma-E family)
VIGVEGGEDGFRAWVAVRREPLRRSVYLMCGDWFLADDVVQDAMTRLFAVWDRVVRRGDPEAYVRRIVVNLLIDHNRRPARREIPRDSMPDRPGPDEGEGQREVLVAALAEIAPRQRATLVFRFWEGLSVEETASIMNCSEGTVKSNTSKGLANLRSVLTQSSWGQEPANVRDGS